MARRANRESVERGVNGPDFDAALAIIKTIWTDQTESRTISGEIGAKWKRIEELGVNKVGAQMFNKIAKLEPDIRDDVLRTFLKLSKSYGALDSRDLVDVMEGGATLGEQVLKGDAPDAMDDFDAADPKLRKDGVDEDPGESEDDAEAERAAAGTTGAKPAASDFKPDLTKQAALEKAKAGGKPKLGIVK